MTVGAINIACTLLMAPVIYFLFIKERALAILMALAFPVITANVIVLVTFDYKEVGPLYGLAAIFWGIIDAAVSGFIVFLVEVIVEPRRD